MMYGVLVVVALVAAGASSAEQSTPGRLVRAAFAQGGETSPRDNAYVYVHPDGASMDGTDSDRRRAISHRAKYGDRYLWFRRDGKEYVVTDRVLLGEGAGPIVAATDYVRAVAESIRAFLPDGRSFVTLGTDGFGRSDTRAALRDCFGVDAAHIVKAVRHALSSRPH